MSLRGVFFSFYLCLFAWDVVAYGEKVALLCFALDGYRTRESCA